MRDLSAARLSDAPHILFTATMLYYRFHSFPVDADAPLGATLARVKESLDKAGLKNVPLRFCFFGPRGCAAVMAKFPELRRFFSTAGRKSDDPPVEHLSDFGPSAPGAFAGPSGKVAFKTIAAVIAGIPQEFSIHLVHLSLGPILKGTTLIRSSHLHSSLMEMDMQSISLNWQSSPSSDGRRYSLSFIEPLPTAAPRQPAPTWIQTLYSTFPGAFAGKIRSEIDSIMVDYSMVVSGSSGSFIGAKSIGDDLKLPNELADSQAATHLAYALLRGVRSTIAHLFEDDRWKQAAGRQSGMYELRKTSPGGRCLGLLFWIQKRGRSSRCISVRMRLFSQRRSLVLGILAERSTRRDYEVPNPQVLNQILDNMRVVVKHLEKTWVTELEEALGPRPRRR